MSYGEYYLTRKLSGHIGLGSKVWLLKLPREADNASGGSSLLGSLVEEVDRFLGVDYPSPFHLSKPRLFLKQIEAKKKELDLNKEELAEMAKKNSIAGTTAVLSRSNGLDMTATGNFPGLPIKASMGVDYESTSRIVFGFGPGSYFQKIPTDYLGRLARHYGGDDRLVDPAMSVSISDNLIVDMVVIGKNYTLEFVQNSKLEANFDIEAKLASADFGGKFKFTRASDFSFKVQVLDNVEYLVGIKTIDWDDLD